MAVRDGKETRKYESDSTPCPPFPLSLTLSLSLSLSHSLFLSFAFRSWLARVRFLLVSCLQRKCLELASSSRTLSSLRRFTGVLSLLLDFSTTWRGIGRAPLRRSLHRLRCRWGIYIACVSRFIPLSFCSPLSSRRVAGFSTSRPSPLSPTRFLSFFFFCNRCACMSAVVAFDVVVVVVVDVVVVVVVVAVAVVPFHGQGSERMSAYRP